MRSSRKRRQGQVKEELSLPAVQGKLRELAQLIDSLTGQSIETKEQAPKQEGT